MMPIWKSDADRDVISAINENDMPALGTALEAGGAAPGTEALKLLISAATGGEPFCLLPTRMRGQKANPLEGLGVSPWHLRSGLPPDIRSKLIELAQGNLIWVGRRRLNKRGPRSDTIRFAKILRDGARIEAIIRERANQKAFSEAEAAPIGSLIPVRVTRGMQAEAIAKFIEEQPQLGMSKQDATRYAKRALSAVRAYRKTLDEA